MGYFVSRTALWLYGYLRPAIRRSLIGAPTRRGGLPISCQISNLKSEWRLSSVAWSRSTGRLGDNDQAIRDAMRCAELLQTSGGNDLLFMTRCGASKPLLE